MAIHLQPTAPLAERVLLPGDPGRALRLAQALIEAPKMFNHNRGLWGYSGPALIDGSPLTIQSTGMGGPSAAIVISELIELGARTLVRVGTCGALTAGPGLGELVLVTDSLCVDGTSRALGAGSLAGGDVELFERLRSASGAPPARAVRAASTDLFYETRDGLEAEWAAAGAAVVEMETATLFTLAGREGAAAGAALIVSDLVLPRRARIDAEALGAAELALGELAARAVSAG